MNKVKQINVVITYSRTIEMEKIENTPYSYYKIQRLKKRA